MRVRLSSYDDRDVIASLRRDWAEEQAGEPLPDPAFEDLFAEWFEREHDQRLAWLGYAGDVAVGMLNLLVFTRMPKPAPPGLGSAPRQWGYVANVYVHEGHRSGGLGAELLAACTAYADERGFARLVLSPTERSVPFYARAGFVPATTLLVRTAPVPPG